MARMIDADKFLSSMIKRFKCVPLIGRNDYDCESLKRMLIEAPTVDAVPVVHGRWITDEKGVTYCGRCRIIDDYASVHNYCPNCGARMDLKEESDA